MPIIILVLSLTEAALGSLSCKNMFVTGKDNLPAQFETAKAKIEFIAREIGFDINSVPLILTEPTAFAAYDFQLNLIEMPMKFLKADRYANHPNYTTAIFSHEMTHAIVEFYMITHSQIWQQYRKVFEATPAALKEKLSEVNQVLDRMGQTDNALEMNTLRGG